MESSIACPPKRPELGSNSFEPDWKQRLRVRFEFVLATIKEPPDDSFLDSDGEELDNGESLADQPDLYSFFETLSALRNESRRGNRRTAEIFSQFGDSLGGLEGEIGQLRRQLQALEDRRSPSEAISRPHLLCLLEMDDRVRRLKVALEVPPSSKYSFLCRASSTAWQNAWDEIGQAVDMLDHHLSALLAQLDLKPIHVMERTFDPTLMKAVAREFTPDVSANVVIEEISRGYLYQGAPLRLAEVKVSAPAGRETATTERAIP